MLQGCLGSTSQLPGQSAPTLASSALPDIPVRDQARCYEPGVNVGEQPLVELARTRVALADCRKRHWRLVQSYLNFLKLHANTKKEASK